MPTILTINSGSSSLKLGLYRADAADPTQEPQLVYRGATDAIGKPGGSLTVTDSAGKTIHREDASHDSQSSAFQHAAQKLQQLSGTDMSRGPDAIGYRIVHGGPHLRQHCRITPQVLDTLRAATHPARARTHRHCVEAPSTSARLRVLRYRIPHHHAARGLHLCHPRALPRAGRPALRLPRPLL